MDIAALLDKAEPADKAELTILHNAHVTALKSVQDGATEAALRTYKSAKEALDALVARLSVKYYGPPEDPPFESRVAVLKYLQVSGYKVKKSKLYLDCKNGLLRIQPDGKVLRKDVDRYLRLARLAPVSATCPGPDIDLSSRRQEKEIEYREAQIAKLDFDLAVAQKKYVLRSEYEMELASRLAVLSAAFDQMLSESVPEVLEPVVEDLSDMGRILEGLKRRKESMFNRLAEGMFDVEFV